MMFSITELHVSDLLLPYVTKMGRAQEGCNESPVENPLGVIFVLD